MLLEAILLTLVWLGFAWLAFAARMAYGPLSKFDNNPLSLMVLAFGFTAATGMTLVLTGIASVPVLKLVEDGAFTRSAIGVALAFLLMGLTLVILKGAFPKYSAVWPIHERKLSGLTARHLDVFAVSAAGLSILCVLYIYANLPVYPQLMIGQAADEVARARVVASQGFTGNRYIRNIFGAATVPMIAAILYDLSFHRRNKLTVYAARLSIVSAAMLLTYNLAKSPVILFLLVLLLIRLRHKRRLGLSLQPVFRATQAGFILIIIIVSLYALTGVQLDNATDVNDLSSPTHRLLVGQLTPLILHFDAFPEKIPFQYGASLFAFARAEDHPISARLVMEMYYPDDVAQGTAGFAVSYFTAEAWANFGWIGIGIAPILAIFMIYFGLALTVRLPGAISGGILAYLIVHIPFIMRTSFFRIIYNPEILVSIAVVYILLVSIRRRTETRT